MTEEPNEQVQENNEQVQIDPLKLQVVAQQIREGQNLVLGVIAGVAAAAAGAAAWAIVTAVTNYQIGWMAVAVGFLVGMAVRRVGRGVDTIFGIIGAALSLVGCLSGNLLAICILASKEYSVPLLEIISRLNPGIVAELMKATFSPIDLLFYGLAIYEGYKFSFRQIGQDDLASLATEGAR